MCDPVAFDPLLDNGFCFFMGSCQCQLDLRISAGLAPSLSDITHDMLPDSAVRATVSAFQMRWTIAMHKHETILFRNLGIHRKMFDLISNEDDRGIGR